MTKTKLVVLVAALLAAAMSHASAAATYLVQGSVPQLCSMQLPRLLSDRAPINVTDLTGNSIAITQLTDPTTMATKATQFDVGFDAVCNYAHRLVVESQNNGLWRDALTGPAPGFADAVPYTAVITWGDTTTTFRADAEVKQIANVTVPVNKPTEGQIELQFEIRAGAANGDSFAPMLAGRYSDIIRVTVEPQ
jgi:hypothetical protein